MKIRRKKGFFSISAVAKMFSVHQQTVRLYEKQGLIAPKRSTGNTRLFSEEDIDRLEGNKEIKDWLKGLWKNLKDKAKDDIVDMVIDGVKIYGPSVIVVLINLLSSSTS